MKSTAYIKTSDADIKKAVRIAAKGNKAAFSNLVLGLENKLYRVSRSVLRNDADCADAIQETLIRAWLKLPALRDPELFEHWLVRILLNECYRITRQARPIKFESEPYVNDRDITENLVLENAVYEFYELSIEQRVPLVLHYSLGYKVNEIADMLHIPSGTVKTRLMRGKRRMYDILKEDYNE